MKAVWFRARADLRSRRASLLGLALLLGVAAGAIQASAIGARRTESAYPRFIKASRALDFVVSPNEPGDRTSMESVSRMPQVADSTYVFLVPGKVTAPNGRSRVFPDIFPLVDRTGKLGTTLNIAKVLEGRYPDPRHADEAAISFGLADSLDLSAGSTVRFDVYGENANGDTTTEPVATMPMRIVGVVAAPGMFQAITGASIPALLLSPQWAQEHPQLVPPGEEALVVRLGADVTPDEFLRAIRASALNVSADFSQTEQTTVQQRSNRFQAIALWILAGMAGLAALGIFGPALARQAFMDAQDNPALSALGMSSGQLVAVGMVRAAAVAAVAAPIGAVIAYLLTPLTPVGLARVAEPTPGLWLDWSVLLAGAGIVLVAIPLMALPGTWRAARLASSRREHDERIPLSRVASPLASAGLPPSTVVGVSMALEPGRGRTAVPVRAAILGTTFGIAALLAAITFSGSLQLLLREPQLSGWNWDDIVGPQGAGTTSDIDEAEAHLGADPNIKEFSKGTLTDLRIGSQRVLTLALSAGPVQPSVIEGRAPASRREIALGTQTLRALDVEIGDSVNAAVSSELGVGDASGTLPFRVVGRVAVPSFFFSNNEPGTGAAITIAGLQSLTPSVQADAFFLRFVPGAGARGEDSLRKAGFFIVPRRQTEDVTNLRRVAGTPVILALLLAALAVGTLVHTLLTTIRRRGRDLAILKTLGFRRSQLLAAVVWQGSTLAVVSVVLGVPIGIALGRLAWRLFADQLGVVPSPALPWMAVAIIGPAAVIVASAIAFLPGRAAARVHPADVLRAE